MIVNFVEQYYLKRKQKKRVKEMEKEIPFVLRSFATLLNSGLSFEKAIEKIAGENYFSSREFLKASNEIKLGESVPVALQRFLRRNNSREVKKMINLLTSAYVNGENVSVLKRVAVEQGDLIQNKLKEYNEKLGFYSLVIVSVSAVLPAFAQGFLIIGSAFMDLGISGLQAFALIVLVFPVLNLVVFWISVSKKP